MTIYSSSQCFFIPVPRVYLVIEIDGREVTPGSQTTTHVLSGTRPSPEVIRCRTRGPMDLTSPVDQTLNWTFSLTNTSLAPFNSISGTVPPAAYTVFTSSGNITVDVSAGVSAGVSFNPQLTPELQGRYQCTGNSMSEGAIQQEVNIVLGKCNLSSAMILAIACIPSSLNR